MPGLFGSFGASSGERLAAMEKALEARPSYHSIRRLTPFAALGLLHHGVLDDPVAGGDDLGILIDGWLWSRYRQHAGATPAEICLSLYGDYGPGFLDHVDGEFTLALWDRKQRRAILANDRFGLRPLNIYRAAESFYFAPEAKALLAAGIVEAKLDRGTLQRYLSYGRIFMDAGTFFQGVEILEPATTLVFETSSGHSETGRFETYRRSTLSYRPRSRADENMSSEMAEEMAEEVAESLRSSVRRRLRPGIRYGIHLSGGLDSRLIAGLMAAELGEHGVGENRVGENGPLACTFGMLGSGEVALAEQIASRLGLRSSSVTLTPQDFLEHAQLGVWRTEGLDLLTQSYAFAAFPHFAPEVDVMTTGLALDLPLGGSFLREEFFADNATESTAFRDVESKTRTMAPELVARLLGDEAAPRQSAAELRDLWLGHIEDSAEHPADLVDGFMLRWRVWRVIIQRQAWNRLFYEEMTPSFDDALFDLMLEIPARERLGHRFYQKVLNRLTPQLMDIPYQRTLLPPTAPVELWPAAARLEAQRERLYFDVWQRSGGRMHLPYLRYFSNYDEWLRLDKSWAAFFDQLFTASNAALPACGFDLDVIEQLLREHRSGKANHRQALLQLATLEIFLQQFQLS